MEACLTNITLLLRCKPATEEPGQSPEQWIQVPRVSELRPGKAGCPGTGKKPKASASE